MISRTHHKNLIGLIGYRIKDPMRLLLYEYMSHGSLADIIFCSAIGFISASFIELNKLVHGKDVDKKNLENIVKVGLWCVQDEPALRPSMKCVVMMLEGITDIANPPCPTASSGKIL